MSNNAAPRQYHHWNPELATEALQEFQGQPGTLMNALHKVQNLFGYVDDEAIRILARFFNLSRAEVHGVASFYHDFRTSKPGRYLIKVCQAEACQAMGSEKLTDEIRQHLGIDFHETSKDGNFTLEPVYCLGNCACSPNIMVDHQVHARMSAERFKQLTRSLTEEVK
jgi:formate dehydrogenase subunit gamma